MVSINGINQFQNNYNVQQSNSIKPQTMRELQALGISTQNIKTETQAQQIIKEFKELQQVQNQLQSQGIGTQNSQNAQATQNVPDMKSTQQVSNVDNSQQSQAMAGGQAGAIQGQQQAFQMMHEIIAQQNRLKLGLI